MQISDEYLAKFKALYKEEKGEELSDADAYDQASRLLGFFEILWKSSQEESAREHRLKKEPDGFPVTGNYTCAVCGNSINPETGLYHWGGPRCLLCHKAIISGVVPTYVLKHRDSFFSIWHLADAFKVRTVTIRKMVREGKLKARAILADNGKVHEYIFLRKENPKLVERYSPARKSWDRNRNKVADRWARKTKMEMKADMEKINKKYQKKLKN